MCYKCFGKVICCLDTVAREAMKEKRALTLQSSSRCSLPDLQTQYSPGWSGLLHSSHKSELSPKKREEAALTYAKYTAYLSEKNVKMKKINSFDREI